MVVAAEKNVGVVSSLGKAFFQSVVRFLTLGGPITTGLGVL
jgi:hypothetical protein